jgi:hypothetical protein
MKAMHPRGSLLALGLLAACAPASVRTASSSSTGQGASSGGSLASASSSGSSLGSSSTSGGSGTAGATSSGSGSSGTASGSSGSGGSGSTGAIVYSGPIVITHGGTYTGNWESTDPAVSPVTVATSEVVIITGSNMRGAADLIRGDHVRLTVLNSHGEGVNPNVPGQSVGNFVNLGNVEDLRIENNDLEHTHGIGINHFAGDAGAGDTIRILRNRAHNVDGRQSDGDGGYIHASTFAHFVLFDHVQRVVGAEIGWNQVIDEPFQCWVEDVINMYVSSGVPSSPIRIHDNFIQGAYPPDPTVDGYSGGGILLGDGTSTVPEEIGYAEVTRNHIVSTSNYGLAVTGGVEHHVFDNRVVSSGRLPDGRGIAAQNVGLYEWDPNNLRSNNPPTFAGNSVDNNVVAWTRVFPDGGTLENQWWFPDCGVNGSTCAGNQAISPISLADEAYEIQLWRDKLADAGVTVGAP